MSGIRYISPLLFNFRLINQYSTTATIVDKNLLKKNEKDELKYLTNLTHKYATFTVQDEEEIYVQETKEKNITVQETKEE